MLDAHDTGWFRASGLGSQGFSALMGGSMVRNALLPQRTRQVRGCTAQGFWSQDAGRGQSDTVRDAVRARVRTGLPGSVVPLVYILVLCSSCRMHIAVCTSQVHVQTTAHHPRLRLVETEEAGNRGEKRGNDSMMKSQIEISFSYECTTLDRTVHTHMLKPPCTYHEIASE